MYGKRIFSRSLRGAAEPKTPEKSSSSPPRPTAAAAAAAPVTLDSPTPRPIITSRPSTTLTEDDDTSTSTHPQSLFDTQSLSSSQGKRTTTDWTSDLPSEAWHKPEPKSATASRASEATPILELPETFGGAVNIFPGRSNDVLRAKVAQRAAQFSDSIRGMRPSHAVRELLLQHGTHWQRSYQSEYDAWCKEDDEAQENVEYARQMLAQQTV